MPWSSKDAAAKTRKASTPSKKRKWAAVANDVLSRTNDEGRAVRAANAAMRRASKPKGAKA